MSDDMKNLQGTWQMITFEMNGSPFHQAAANSRMQIDGDNFTALGMGAIYEGKFTLDLAQNPKTIDMEFTAGPEKGGKSFGIYKLDGDKWTICLSVGGAARPTAFATAPNSNHALETFEKIKQNLDATLKIDTTE